jgi:F-type H+-transporting ATPase subunit gamma
MIKRTGHIDHPYLLSGTEGKRAVVVITSNRGLAGGYNSNIVKLVMGADFDRQDTLVYAIGKKGRDTLKRHGYQIQADYSEVVNEPLFKDAMDITEVLLDAYANKEIREIWLAYTGFKNTVSHIPTLIKLLPVDGGDSENEEENPSDSADDSKVLMNYEPEETEALELIIPKYVSSLIYGALIEAVASENGARMQAMDSATSNAEEMIDTLELQYNRARQGHITQELTEIIGGAEALSS